MTNTHLASARPSLPDLLDQVLSRQDWIRLIRRLARSNDLAGLSLLLRCRYGAPGRSSTSAAVPARRYVIWLPSIDDDDPLPPTPPPETGEQALARLLDEALSPADWAMLLRRLAHRKGSRGLSLLLQFRHGLSPTTSRAVVPAESEPFVRFYDPAESDLLDGASLE